MKIAKQFWKKQKTYPSYGTIKQRRLYELNYLVPKLEGVKSLLDLGCGDGSLIKCLRNLTNIEKYYGYDIATTLMKDTPAELKEYDCEEPTELPQVDFVVCAGVIPFLDNPQGVLAEIKKLQCPVFIKAPCSMDKPVEVNSYSEKLKDNYQSYYRTIPQMLDLLKDFEIVDVSRAYPDEIESEFGTKQIIFLCK